MTKFFVKKPFFVVVAVIIILVLGGVSLTRMQTDLLPSISLNYLMVITTEPGASADQIKMDIAEPMESALGTLNGVNNISTSSSDNFCLVTLEYDDDQDMDAALVRVSMALDSLSLPEMCSKPTVMELGVDMLATMYVTVDKEGLDIKENTSFTDNVVIPYLERQAGVASISAVGMIEDTVEIRLNQSKIDEVNDKILIKTNSKLADALKDIEKAEKELDDATKELEKQEKNLKEQQSNTNTQIADASVQLAAAQASKAAYEANLNSLNASKTALEAELKTYTDMDAEGNLQKIDEGLVTLSATLNATMGDSIAMLGFNIPENVDQVLADKDNFDAFKTGMESINPDAVAALDYDTISQLYDIVNVRIPQINTALSNLNIEIIAAQAIVDELVTQMEGMDDKHSEALAGGYDAAAGFGAAQAGLANGKAKLEEGKAQLKDAKKQYRKAKKAALESANINALISLDTLSGIIYAQNFSMPAGYIDDEDDNQWLIEVGDNFADTNEIESLVLADIDGVGEIKVSDVADLTVIDNVGETYAKMNGNDAVILAIYKASTASTSDVSKTLEKAFDKLEADYEGLSLVPIMDQGDYIDIIIKSVLSSILLGALLAIIVLALFLRDVKPTIVVAFSIPFSVLFALIIMYFTGINLNAMSLAGLCLGIGMLVDNSIVVMENIYRLRNKGIPAAKAAVQGAKQVAGPIIASTITTICVFFPMVYTSGLVSQLMVPFAFTISYALVASLIVALTVVPTMSSVMLNKTKEKKDKVFDAVKKVYGKILAFCLKVKVVPLGIAIALLAFCIIRTASTGLVLIDDMESNQISVSMTLDAETDKESAYAIADEVTEKILAVEGIDKVGVMDSSVSAVSGLTSGREGAYLSYNFNIITAEGIKSVDDFRRITADLEESVADIDAEITVASSALGEMTQVMGSGVQINIYGSDTDKLMEIAEQLGDILESKEGLDNIDNGISDKTEKLHLTIDRAKAASKNLTAAQIYQAVAARMTESKKAITMTVDSNSLDVNVIDETDPLTYDNLMDLEISVNEMKDDGTSKEKKYPLSEFASIEITPAMDTIRRENQSNYIPVRAEVLEGYNATLISRELEEDIKVIDVPDGYTIDMSGEYEEVMSMVRQMMLALLLGALLVYLVMVAQFQSMLSPFIILFTVPLAFTGGMLGLMAFGMDISAMSLMGFMILMGTVVNNGIVFVDYVNKLRIGGIEKREALILTGQTRMRPILMTAITTILSMSVMVFSKDAGNAMQKSMAIVVTFGLLYSTFMTLFIVPVMYDIFYRKQPKVIDVGEDIGEEYDEAKELLGTLAK